MQIHDAGMIRGVVCILYFVAVVCFEIFWFICLWREILLQCVSKHERSISYRLRALYFQKNSPKSTPNIHYSTVPRGNNRLLPLTVPYRTCVKKKQLYKAVDSTASSSFGSIADPFDSLDSDLIIWERLSRKVIFKLVFFNLKNVILTWRGEKLHLKNVLRFWSSLRLDFNFKYQNCCIILFCHHVEERSSIVGLGQHSILF